MSSNLPRLGFGVFISSSGAASLNYVLSPLLWGIAMAWVLLPEVTMMVDIRVMLLCYGVMLVGFIMQWWSAWYVSRDVPARIGLFAILGYPLYFILHAVAGLRAAWQLVTRPYYWDKTCHGISKISRPDLTQTK